MNLNNKVAKKIKAYRKYKNITQDNMAKALNVSRITLSKIETGKQNISFNHLESILSVFEISFTEFFEQNEGVSEKIIEIANKKAETQNIIKSLERRKEELKDMDDSILTLREFNSIDMNN